MDKILSEHQKTLFWRHFGNFWAPSDSMRVFFKYRASSLFTAFPLPWLSNFIQKIRKQLRDESVQKSCIVNERTNRWGAGRTEPNSKVAYASAGVQENS